MTNTEARILALVLTVATPISLFLMLLIDPASDGVVAVPVLTGALAALVWTVAIIERRTR